MMDGARWQPSGEQFAYACMVCIHRKDTVMTLKCENCRMEKKAGFEFDPNRYIKLMQKITGGYAEGNKNCMIGGERGAGKLFHLEQTLSILVEDRNYWRDLAESAIQHNKRMTERQIK